MSCETPRTSGVITQHNYHDRLLLQYGKNAIPSSITEHWTWINKLALDYLLLLYKTEDSRLKLKYANINYTWQWTISFASLWLHFSTNSCTLSQKSLYCTHVSLCRSSLRGMTHTLGINPSFLLEGHLTYSHQQLTLFVRISKHWPVRKNIWFWTLGASFNCSCVRKLSLFSKGSKLRIATTLTPFHPVPAIKDS